MPSPQAIWERARLLFERARELEESAEVLDGLSRALHFEGDYPRAIECTELAFAAYCTEGRSADAADRARWLAFLQATINGNMAVAGGWMARAEELLADTAECASHGWLRLDQAPFSRDPVERERLASAALAIASDSAIPTLNMTPWRCSGRHGFRQAGSRMVCAASTRR